jgi:16S rRNA C967 or C1407 C5-methylase (RsmB/RsmF family)
MFLRPIASKWLGRFCRSMSDEVPINASKRASKHQKLKKEPAVSKNKQKKIKQLQTAVDTQNQLFNSYFTTQYSKERWERLSVALLGRPKYVAMLNKYANREFARRLLSIDTQQTIPFLPELFNNMIYTHARNDISTNSHIVPNEIGTFEVDSDGDEAELELTSKNSDAHDDDVKHTLWPSPSHHPDANGLSAYYPLDAASLFPVMLLDLQPGHHVLDLCAAPGGKSLFILQHLQNGYLTCNDVSYERKKRLHKIIRQYLPSDRQDRVQVPSSPPSMVWT